MKAARLVAYGDTSQIRIEDLPTPALASGHGGRAMARAFPMNLVLLDLSLFMLWGRWRQEPIAPRGDA
ncbi:MAG: hypothetical protein ABS35_16675 [Kaistia sp. SCN 65-12]|nr:MAG: hypothetical protein ABS35_16675 [Kaistia sp. SCN 65-12]